MKKLLLFIIVLLVMNQKVFSQTSYTYFINKPLAELSKYLGSADHVQEDSYWYFNKERVVKFSHNGSIVTEVLAVYQYYTIKDAWGTMLFLTAQISEEMN